MHKESWYAEKLAKKLNGKTEVRTQSGNIDVLTDLEVIEVKAACGWKSALGQVLAYGYFYPEHSKRIHCIGKPSDVAVKVCQSVGVSLTWEKITLAEEVLKPNRVDVLNLNRIKSLVNQFNQRQKELNSSLTLKVSSTCFRMSILGKFPVKRTGSKINNNTNCLRLESNGFFTECYEGADIVFAELAKAIKNETYRWYNWTPEKNRQRMIEAMKLSRKSKKF